MSIKALNWAIDITVGNPLTKSILVAIANYADAEGICWPSHNRLAGDCEVSVATVKRRIIDLEELGLLTAHRCWIDDDGVRNREGRGRETSRQIHLHINRSRSPKANSTDDSDPGRGAPAAPPHSPLEGAPPAPGGAQAELPGGSLRTPPNEPSLNQEKTPNPLRGGNRDNLDLNGFREFKLDYPKTGLWVWSKCEPLWAALTPHERTCCRAAVLPYSKQTARDKPPPRRPDVWLRERMWENYPTATIPTAQSAPPQRVWIADKDLAPLDFAMRMCGRVGAPRIRDDERGSGIWRKGVLEADLNALELFIDVDRTDWQQLDEGSQEFGAWFTRLKSWTGFAPELQRIPVGPHLPEHDLPRWDPKFKLQKMINVLRVPCRWPPRKDGTFHEESEGE